MQYAYYTIDSIWSRLGRLTAVRAAEATGNGVARGLLAYGRPGIATCWTALEVGVHNLTACRSTGSRHRDQLKWRMPSQSTSVHPVIGLPVITTRPMFGSGWLVSRLSLAFLVFISVQHMMA